MKYEWRVCLATLAAPQPTYEPPQLQDVLDRLAEEDWEIFALIPEPATSSHVFNRVRVVARRPAK